MPATSRQALGLLSFALGLSVAASGLVHAQPRIAVDSRATCSGCRLALSRTAVLGGADDPVSPEPFARVVRIASGRYVAAPAVDGARLIVYGRDGRFLRTLGRRGKGPGEFQWPTLPLPDGNGGLLVVDPMMLRFTRFSPDLRLRGTTRIDGLDVQNAFLDGSGGLVAYGWTGAPERAGLPLHAISREGRLLRSFGGGTEPVRMDRLGAEFRIIAPASPTTFWSARRGRYEIELWDYGGRLLRTLTRSADWYLPWTSDEGGPAHVARPHPRVVGMWQDARGLLWVMSNVAERDWKPARRLSPREMRREQGFTPPGELSRYVDTIVEVIDPRRGTLVASGRFGRALRPVAGAGNQVFSHRSDATGLDYIYVWEMALVQPRTGGQP